MLLVLRLKTLKIIFLLLSVFLTFNCLSAREVPSSARSVKAIARVKPLLEKEMSAKGLKFGAPIFIRIYKEEKELEMWVKKGNKFELFTTYSICTYGDGTLGPKLAQGDEQAPEGFYFTGPGGMNPFSSYHLSFNIGYPNRYDRHHNRTGSFIMIHGRSVSIGCYALTDSNIEEIYALADSALRNGQPFFRIHIFPFKMTSENMKKHKNSKWYSFWENLKEGHDLFEKNGNNPPNVEVKNGKYVFD
jgi:murein L,D-transpeptidase YafK